MIKKLRLFLACAGCRLSHRVLRLMRRGGTSFPGRLALKLCPDAPRLLSRDMEVILVTGTNGKTTTCQMLRRMAAEQGRSYVSNLAGANMADGITAVLACGARLSGKPKSSLAIIECDEGAMPAMSRALSPRVIVVTNLFRDQLDRYGEISLTRAKIRTAIESAPQATLCLNADCSLTATLAEGLDNKTMFFGVDALTETAAAAISDAPRCLSCGEAYQYHRRSFAHLGDWYCPGCGRRRPAPDLCVTSAGPGEPGTALELDIRGEKHSAQLSLPAAYNIYNAAAALTCAMAAGWDMGISLKALGLVEPPFGRLERFELGGTPVQLLLAKNPAGMDRILEYLSALPGEFESIFCLNDNYPDGTDVSWIWDADFERFAQSHCAAAVYGLRRGDILLRLKYAGMDDKAIVSCPGLAELKALIRASDKPVYIAANYTSMLQVREALAAETGKGHF